MIAAKLGHSETAFVNLKPTDTSFVADASIAGHEVRFFTPTQEIALCGHATIGSYHILGEKGLITPGTYTMKTDSGGTLQIHYAEGGQVSMEQNLPTFRQIELQPQTIAKALGLKDSDTFGIEEQPIKVASTGNW